MSNKKVNPLRVLRPAKQKPTCKLEQFLATENKKPWYIREKPYGIKCGCPKCRK